MSDIQGYVAPGLEPVRAAFEASFNEGAELGAGLCVMRGGETLIDLWGGWRDSAKSAPWERDTIVSVFSTTKAISALVVAKLVGEGKLDYEAPVSALWPEFGAHGKDKLTLAQVLSHQAGVPGFVEPIDPALWLDPPACAAAIAALAPLWPPGSASGYHPLTWGYLLNEIVSRATGRTIGAILREEICGPAKIDFQIGLPEADDARAASMKKPTQIADFGEITPAKVAAFFSKWSSPPRGDAAWRRIEVPSANGHGTARAVAQLFEAYANGGEIGGLRVVDPLAFAELEARRALGPDLVLPFTLDWRSGVLGNNNQIYGPNPHALGHSGSGGSCGFGDPGQRISFGYVMNKQSHFIMGDPRPLRLIEVLYSCL